jgi:hypothetical protein
MPHDPTAEQVIEEWAAMVERLYGTATPTASTDPAMSAPPTKPQPTCCPATAASSTRPLHGKEILCHRLPTSPPCERGGRFLGFAKRSSPANPKARRTQLDTNTD